MQEYFIWTQKKDQDSRFVEPDCKFRCQVRLRTAICPLLAQHRQQQRLYFFGVVQIFCFFIFIAYP